MERLQWWLLLLSAVMFSMSGCSSTKAWQGTALSDWQVWAQHSSHFASGQHLTFSIKSHPTPAVATASTAAVPSASAPAPIDRKDITGVWRGRWAANGSWGERRESDAQMIFAQLGTKGTARMVLTDTVAATGVPEVVRHFGALGTPMNIRVSRSEVVARFEDGPAVLVRFKREGDRLYGRIDASPSFLLVLERQ